MTLISLPQSLTGSVLPPNPPSYASLVSLLGNFLSNYFTSSLSSHHPRFPAEDLASYTVEKTAISLNLSSCHQAADNPTRTYTHSFSVFPPVLKEEVSLFP